mmetsp:Transcript_50185/g.116531  ORF Transcript_50185/g.116531 Transcript_50185/m.116531 type:complete len:205 (-) Transcript_50185:105-719(-)
MARSHARHSPRNDPTAPSTSHTLLATMTRSCRALPLWALAAFLPRSSAGDVTQGLDFASLVQLEAAPNRTKKIDIVGVLKGSMPHKVYNGNCTAEDEAKMLKLGPGNADGTFPKVMARCAQSSWHLMRGFQEDDHRGCIEDKVGLSEQCINCFHPAAVAGAKRCKIRCILSPWCGRGCLDCTTDERTEMNKCVGFIPPLVAPCK